MDFDWQPVWLTLHLAGVTTLILLIGATPLAWWLARGESRWRRPVAAVVALPLVLPPTVLGFYLLLALGPDGPIGRLTQSLGVGTLAFTFEGLVLASVIYSLPFAVQPLQNAFEALGRRPLEVAATLGAGPWDRFLSVALPLSRSGFLTAAVLVFAHTVGEFGVVLMIGGSIPGETRVLSVTVFELVETMDYRQAHLFSAGLLAFSFLVLLGLYVLEARWNGGRRR